MDIFGNNEAARFVCGDIVPSPTNSPASFVPDYAWTLSTSAGASTTSNYWPDYSEELRGFINFVNGWYTGSIGTVTSADKNNGAKVETKKDIGFDAFAEVLEDAS